MLLSRQNPLSCTGVDSSPTACAEYLSDADRVLKGAGNHWGPNQEVIHSEGTVMVNGERCVASTLPLLKCLICYEMTRSYTALGCGHAFCIECYTSYISHKIVDEGHNCIFATCPDVQCSLVVSERLVHSLPLPAERRVLFDKARRLDRSYVDDNANIKWCTAAGCGCAIRARKGQMGVQCSCGKRFCFSCNQDDHRPASCDELRRWQIKCHDDSETYNWLMTNTKACPKCQTSIEKNGGCNHMTCKTSSCKFEFCWVCLKPWKEHSGSYYSCNRYDPEKEVSNLDSQMNSSRAALDRYLHYYTRFMNHHNSLKFEVEAKQKMEEKIKELEKQGDKIWMDCNYLIEANDALYECRYALQYTYVYAFYLPQQGNYRAHFEMNQTELEQQTENLSGMLEKDVKEINRPDVVHCFQVGSHRGSAFALATHCRLAQLSITCYRKNRGGKDACIDSRICFLMKSTDPVARNSTLRIADGKDEAQELV